MTCLGGSDTFHQSEKKIKKTLIAFFTLIAFLSYNMFMKLYTFFFYDSYEGMKKNIVEKYVIRHSRFSLAFKSFVQYLNSVPNYIGYMSSYSVFNGHKTQYRSFSDSDLIYLSCLKDKHNAKFYEGINNDEIY